MSDEERKAQKKAYYLANKEKIRARQKAHHQANKEKIGERVKAYKLANKEKIAAQAKDYYLANKEKIVAYRLTNEEDLRERAKGYRLANKEKIVAEKKAYYLANKENIRAEKNAYRLANRKKVRAMEKAYELANREKITARMRVYRQVNKDTLKAYYQDNKEKIRATAKVWEQANKEKIRARVYGMTETQLVALIEKHDNSCAVCEKKQANLNHLLNIDHCHSTGVVRGILCSPCNTAIGVLGDTLKSINKVILYLQGAQAKSLLDSAPTYYTRKILRGKPEKWSRQKAKTYGMTHEELFELYEIHNYCCALCKKPESDCRRRLSVDQCRETGKVRGLLCGACRTALVNLGDTVESLLNARRYLEDQENE